MGVRVYRSKARPALRGTTDLPFLADVWRGSVTRRHRIDRSPQVAEPRSNVGRLRNGRVHACPLSWRRIHFDRKWSSRCAIGAYSWAAALAHLHHSQSPARGAGGRTTVGWPTPRYCWRISRGARQGDDRWGNAAGLGTVVSSTAEHHVRRVVARLSPGHSDR